ncbi:MAG: hypothetical protein ACK5U8_25050 [Deltaproteobacteria bacterium]
MSRATRSGAMALACALASLAAAGCSTLGSKGSSPEGLPHNGTGPSRALDDEETDVRPANRAIALGSASIESGRVAGDGSLFYASAVVMVRPSPDAGRSDAGPSDAGLSDAGPSDAGPPPSPRFAAPDWTGHGPRTISRSAPRQAEGLSFTTRSPGFGLGAEVLGATHPWEGGYVSDPWALVREDGSVLLYYAAEGGIGVATASSVAGPYEGSTTPQIAAHEGVVPRRPSVIETRLLAGASHAFLMYYEDGGSIAVAGSSDGLSFTPLGELALPAMPARDERDGDEVEVGGPGAIVVTSPARRSFVRLFYESRRSNGNTLVTLAASADGDAFEAFGRPVIAGNDADSRSRRFPSPAVIDERISLLYTWSGDSPGASEGTIFVGIAPAGVRLAPSR